MCGGHVDTHTHRPEVVCEFIFCIYPIPDCPSSRTPGAVGSFYGDPVSAQEQNNPLFYLTYTEDRAFHTPSLEITNINKTVITFNIKLPSKYFRVWTQEAYSAWLDRKSTRL